MAAADEALAFSLAAIQKATAEGARIFAPVEIGEAIENRDTAVEQRDLGAWAEVVSYAGLATGFADKALAISVAQRDRAAEAVVSDAQGSVEGRAPDQPRWSPRSAQDVLVEFERLRTLSASTAQVTFRDLSRLRLNPNSNAIIQRMRSDPLTGGEVTKVSLVNGDFYALLNQLGDRTDFEVAVPGLETATQSADFWIGTTPRARASPTTTPPRSRSPAGPRGSRSARTRAPWCRTAARPSAPGCWRAPSSPLRSTGREIFDPDVTLAWQPAEGAEGYWLEMAADAEFNVMQASEWGVRDTSRRFDGLGPGDHYWRVSSLDRLGLPGVRSLSWRFRIVDDATPPFVTLDRAEGGRDRHHRRGGGGRRGRARRRVTVNDAEVPVADNGGFALTVTPAEGENTLARRRRRPGRQPHRADPRLHLPPGRRRQRSPSTRACRATPRAGSSAPRAELAVAGVSNASRGSGSGWWRRTGRWRCRPSSTRAAASTSPFPPPRPGRPTGSRSSAPTRRSPAPSRCGAPGRDPAGDRPRPAAQGDRQRLARRRPARRRARSTVTVNGSPARLDAGRFAATANLVPGTNGIEIVATDAVGNVAVKRVETMYDVDPPEIVAAAASRPGGAAGPIEVLVEARDASGLRQAAPYILRVGGAERRGFLRCDGATGLCRETLPPEPGALALVEVTVEDYAGNAAKRSEYEGRGRHATFAGIGVLLALAAPAWAQVEPGPAPLLVVYGPEAPTREGDPDHMERLFISVPADLADRLYLRVFDPEPFGQHDTRYGRASAATTTTFRLSGGEGACVRRAAAGPGRRRRPLRPRPRRRRLLRRPRPRRAHLRRGEPHRRASGSPSPPSPPPTAR